MPAVSPAGRVEFAAAMVAAVAAGARPAGLPVPQYGSHPLPWIATVCSPRAGKSNDLKKPPNVSNFELYTRLIKSLKL